MQENDHTNYFVYHNGPEVGSDLEISLGKTLQFDSSQSNKSKANAALGKTVWIFCRRTADEQRYLLGTYVPDAIIDRDDRTISIVGIPSYVLDPPVALQDKPFYKELLRATASFVGFNSLHPSIVHVLRSLVPSDDQPRVSNPPWTRDELILALELYLRDPNGPPSKTNSEVRDLSVTLGLVGKRIGISNSGSYRNINGVYMKLMNFRRFDPKAASQGSVGLTRGNKDEAEVWKEFSPRPDHLRAVATAIVSASTDAHISLDNFVEATGDDFCDAPEGRLLTRLHVTRERNKEIVRKKKAQTIERYGFLACEVCRFDFAARYGDRGHGYIEAHHLRPLHSLTGTAQTKLEDLALVCANCHRMIHSTKRWLKLDELRAILKSV